MWSLCGRLQENLDGVSNRNTILYTLSGLKPVLTCSALED